MQVISEHESGSFTPIAPQQAQVVGTTFAMILEIIDAAALMVGESPGTVSEGLSLEVARYDISETRATIRGKKFSAWSAMQFS